MGLTVGPTVHLAIGGAELIASEVAISLFG